MHKKEGYTKRMERNLMAWRTRFDARCAEARKNEATLSTETRQGLEAAKVSGDAAFAKLGELRAAAGRYAELRDEMDVLWRAIDDTPPVDAAVAAVVIPARRTT
jgi:hypothetical protein